MVGGEAVGHGQCIVGGEAAGYGQQMVGGVAVRRGQQILCWGSRGSRSCKRELGNLLTKNQEGHRQLLVMT